MLLYFWSNFKKRINSTKRPTNDTAVQKNGVYLKGQSTDRNRPVLRIQDFDRDYNYFKWSNQYYFVENITYITNDIVEVTGKLDRLATFKVQIAESEAFIKYATAHYNPMIPDQRVTFYNDNDTVPGDKKVVIPDNIGSVILTVAGDQSAMNPSIVGFTSVYAIPSWNSGNIAKWLYSDTLINELKKIFNNPYDAIISAHWVPWEVKTPNPDEPILIGNKKAPVGCEGYGLGEVGRIQGEKFYLTIPRKYNDWRDYPPYSKYKLYLPFIGAVDFDLTEIENADTMIDVTITKDPIAGTIVYHLTSNTSALNEYYTADIKVPLAVGQSQTEKITGGAKIVGGIGATAAAASAISSGGMTVPLAVATLGGVSTIGAGIAAQFADHASGSGSNGSFALGNSVLYASPTSYKRSIGLFQIAHSFVDDGLLNLAGKPVMQVGPLGSYPGYIQCEGASIDLAGTSEDKSAINEMLNGPGIYLE